MSNAAIDHIESALRDMAFHDIKRASDGEAKMGAFILASCFIEYMAGFVAGKKTTRDDYKSFVKNYLPSYYDPEKLYTDLRCKLVHNYSEGGSYWFTDGKPERHQEQRNGKMIVNLEDFIDDLESALKTLLQEIRTDASKKATALARYNAIGLLGIYTVGGKAK